MSASSNHLVIIGTIIKPHGIRGEVAVETTCDSPDVFIGGRSVLIKKEDAQCRELVIRTVREHHGRALILFEGVDDRTMAESLRGFDLFISETDLGSLNPEEFYHFEIIGSSVVDQQGNHLGVVEGVLETGPSPLLEIALEAGMYLIPFVEEYVLSVDRHRKEIVIRDFQELVSLNQ